MKNITMSMRTWREVRISLDTGHTIQNSSKLQAVVCAWLFRVVGVKLNSTFRKLSPYEKIYPDWACWCKKMVCFFRSDYKWLRALF